MYCKLCTHVRFPNKEARKHVMQLHQAIVIGNLTGKLASVPKELRKHASGMRSFRIETCQVRDILIIATKCDLDAVQAFVQFVLKKYDPAGAVRMEWSFDADYPHADAYGGGAAIVTAKKIVSMSTTDWLEEHAEQSKKGTL